MDKHITTSMLRAAASVLRDATSSAFTGEPFVSSDAMAKCVANLTQEDRDRIVGGDEIVEPERAVDFLAMRLIQVASMLDEAAALAV